MRDRLTASQREAILQASRDAAARGPVGMKEQNGRLVMEYDAVDLACDTGNYWWGGGMSNRKAMAALRLIQTRLRLGR
jgi:hypothetical protein